MSWPDVRHDESEIIQQFQFLQSHLTAESAVEFCEKSPDHDFLRKLHETHHFNYESALQSYLICLRTVVSLVSRSTFLKIFRKSCPGCATLYFLSILSLHPILENEVNHLFRELLCDPRGDILHRNDIRQMTMIIRQAYEHRGRFFLFNGDCEDFGKESQGYKIVQMIGQLFSSAKFLELMKSDPTLGAQIAHEMMRSRTDSEKPSNKLEELVTKYQKFTSENKLDA